jgi:hypothetical protein
MLPSVACAISVSRTLPAAWLSSQAYQNVSATVVTASIGRSPNDAMKNSGPCQIVTPTAISAVATSGERFDCIVGWANPRKAGSSLSGPPSGSTMFMPIASARPYQGVHWDASGADAPMPRLIQIVTT